MENGWLPFDSHSWVSFFTPALVICGESLPDSEVIRVNHVCRLRHIAARAFIICQVLDKYTTFLHSKVLRFFHLLHGSSEIPSKRGMGHSRMLLAGSVSIMNCSARLFIIGTLSIWVTSKTGTPKSSVTFPRIS